MKLLIALGFLTVAYAASIDDAITNSNTAYGYIQRFAIPLGEKIRKAEEEALSNQRIVGGTPSQVGEYPYQAGLLGEFLNVEGTGVCGGSLISDSRIVTAAHCWFDGFNQAWRFTVVLGSNTLFIGGTRIQTSTVAVHPNWFPLLVRNDVAVIYLPTAISFSDTIAPIALPSGSELTEDFAGETAIASGFGLTSDGGSISSSQVLSHVSLSVITNSVCRLAFPLILQDSNICTSSIGGVSTCNGDSGGPLAVIRNNQPILIGVTSFGSGLGCEASLPAAFVRVTSYVDFINQHMQ